MQFHSIYTGFGCSASGMASSDVEGAASRVQRLQHAFFPSRGVVNMGTLSEPREDDAVNTNRPSPHDGYICHRICSTPSSCSTEVTPGHTTTSGNTNTTTSNSACPCPGQAAGSLNDLYGVVREACAQQNVKWPVECQVLPDYVQHLEDWPLYPEPFYEPTGTELRPQPVGDESGRIVYEYLPASTVNYFTRSCVGGNKYVSDDVRPALVDETDATLQFESRFECGNLAKAVQVSECYYELHLRADLYTSRHTQWFYFAVSNTRKDITYRLSIVNLSKGDSLYNHGLRPLLYSCRDAREHAAGWRRCASNIVYYRNQDSEAGCYDSDDETEEDSPTYTLTFNITFPHDHDTVYVAHCYPYSYSDHQQHLLSIQKDPFKSTICRQRILCRSIAGNPVYLLTVTSTDQEEDGRKKRAIVLSARVHPGETPSSWIMKGALDFLTSQHPKAVELRNQFIFKIIPMINPDGVIVGNHRCSLVGRDLNRQYKMVVKEMFPPIWHIKAMVRRLMDEHGVVMFCDIHAHSRKHNMFLYGCENRRSQDNRLREQLFPLLLHYNSGDKLSFRSCKFKVQRCKEGTARVVVWMMGVLHSYTLEASFGGATEGPRAGTHFNILDFLTMGRQFCETLLEYFDPEPGKEKLRNKLLSRLIKKGSSADEPAAVDMSETNSSSGESERQASILRLRKKKNLKTQRKRTARTTVASVVERVTSQMRMEKPERKLRAVSSSSSSSCCRRSSPHQPPASSDSIGSYSPLQASRRQLLPASGERKVPRVGHKASSGSTYRHSFSSCSSSSSSSSSIPVATDASLTFSSPPSPFYRRHTAHRLHRPAATNDTVKANHSPSSSTTTQASFVSQTPRSCLRTSSNNVQKALHPPPPPPPRRSFTSSSSSSSSSSPMHSLRYSAHKHSRTLSHSSSSSSSPFSSPSALSSSASLSNISSPARGRSSIDNSPFHPPHPHHHAQEFNGNFVFPHSAEPLDATEAAARTDTVQETSQDEAGRQESFTESYMERMQEMLASRLALSDNEVEGSSSRSFWDCGDSSSHWDSSRNAPSRHHPFVRSEFGCRSSLGNLGPVVARTLLYTPVRSPRTPKPSPHYTLRASRVASGGLYPSSRRATTGRHKEVSLRKSVILRETRRDESRREKETVKTESSPERNEGRGRGPGVVQQHRFHSQPVLVETSLQNNLTVTGEEMLVKDFSPLRGGSTSGNLHNSTSSYSSSNKMSTTHTSSPLPPPPPPPAVTPEPRTGTVKANVPRIHSSYDNDQLCADIASCDTLFLDIGARETPELIAARNLKGKVKKKKAPQTSATSSGSKSHVGDNGNYTKSKKSTSDALGDLNNDCEKDTQECAEDSQECTAETKTKKKIKIVIGAKKPKPKLSKKKTKMEKESV
ncbi:uncharacterized protein LOC143017765 isoform X1 [Oratosquilla oratoria]|uniref:uncharacterized protein LOC143017765 isoform X1 n=1 Tax=Oratosquilla oratoria TaxID=337810 RepID=UPI003F764942